MRVNRGKIGIFILTPAPSRIGPCHRPTGITSKHNTLTASMLRAVPVLEAQRCERDGQPYGA